MGAYGCKGTPTIVTEPELGNEPEPAEERSQRRRSLIAFLASVGVTIALVAVALLLPVPYVKLAPGPTFNVIGQVDGADVISISGTETFPTTGTLNMTTVRESGGPRGGLTFFDAVGSWFNAADAVVPRELIYPDDISGEQVKARNAAMFSTSESDAIAAALNFLELPIQTEIVATAVVVDAPADGIFQPRDQIIAVNGEPVSAPGDVVSAVQKAPVGTEFTFDIRRDAQDEQIVVTSMENPDNDGVPYIGISVGELYSADFDIDFTLTDVGGPSAGLIFATGIVDKLTPADLTDGKAVAGTGTITPDGTVGPIGGIRQKLAGARGDGAELFLMPAQHCAEAQGYIPDGLTVVPVSTLSEAIGELGHWAAGLPVGTCPAS
jgi:Lon-like protease